MKSFIKILGLALIGLAAAAYGHVGHSHAAPETAPALQRSALQKINEDYRARVKPIFEEKCFDCHSNRTRYPRYYQIPVVHWYIDSDIREARGHIDMTEDFPFRGHHTPQDQLGQIAETTRKGSMPPWPYRILHRGSGLTEEEKKTILEWISRAKALLTNRH